MRLVRANGPLKKAHQFIILKLFQLLNRHQSEEEGGKSLYRSGTALSQGRETKHPEVPEKGVLWFEGFRGTGKAPGDRGRARRVRKHRSQNDEPGNYSGSSSLPHPGREGEETIFLPSV